MVETVWPLLNTGQNDTATEESTALLLYVTKIIAIANSNRTLHSQWTKPLGRILIIYLSVCINGCVLKLADLWMTSTLMNLLDWWAKTLWTLLPMATLTCFNAGTLHGKYSSTFSNVPGVRVGYKVCGRDTSGKNFVSVFGLMIWADSDREKPCESSAESGVPHSQHCPYLCLTFHCNVNKYKGHCSNTV